MLNHSSTILICRFVTRSSKPDWKLEFEFMKPKNRFNNEFITLKYTLCNVSTNHYLNFMLCPVYSNNPLLVIYEQLQCFDVNK